MRSASRPGPAGRLAAAWLAIVVLGLSLAVAAAHGAPGDLDASFGGDGRVVTDVTGGADRARAVAIQADGKIVAAGGQSIVRYNLDGSLDAAFDGDGKVAAVIDVRDVAIQPGGKVVVAGQNGAGQFALARYGPGGALDTSFGTGGTVETFFPPTGVNLVIDAQSAIAHRVLLQADGRIVAGGFTEATAHVDDPIAGGPTTRYGLAIARLTANGVFDNSFSSDGKASVGGPAAGVERTGLALQPDGRIVVASPSLEGDFLVVRLLASGPADASFGAEGKVRTNFGTTGGESDDDATDVAIQAGKILAAGTTIDPSGSRSDFALARYNLDGSIDTAFGTRGKVVTDLGASDAGDATPYDQANRLAIQTGGKIVAAGCAAAWATCGGPTGDFAVAAFNPNGSLDSGFGAGGRVTTPFGPGLDGANDVAFQPSDGRLLAAGWATGAGEDFALARLSAPLPIAAPRTAAAPPAADITRPELSSLSLSPKRFRAARKGRSIATPTGARLSFRLSETARVKFRIERAARGRRSHGRCVKPRRSNRAGRRCTRYRLLRGGFAHEGRAGSNKLRFTGRLRGRRLRPGRYRLRALAIDAAGNRSGRKRVRFRIVRR